MRNVIGIDVSKAKNEVCWVRQLEPLKVKTRGFENTATGHKGLLGWAQKQTGVPVQELTFAMEATGVYHEALAYELHRAGAQVAVLNPAQVRDYASSLGVRTKNDRKDSVVLARFGLSHTLKVWTPEPENIRQLKALTARIETLEADIRRESNRLEKVQAAPPSPVVEQSINSVLAELKAERQRLMKLLDDHINSDPGLKGDFERLKSIPGVGDVLARYMLGVFHSRSFRSARQFAAYLGLVPVDNESGTSVRYKPHLSKAGPAKVRAKLYFPAIVATQHNPVVKATYQRLTDNGKAKKSALGAAMRKLAHICFGVLNNQQNFSPTTA